MKSICLFFQVHQPFRHRRYRFFDIGNDHYYYDDYANETILKEISQQCYLPANNLLLKLINRFNGNFKISFSISGIALEQFELYAPEVIQSFQQLAKTGCVEFLCETYSHSLCSLKDKSTFEHQVNLHRKKIFTLFNQSPTVFKNTEMIYSDEIGAQIYQMGFKGILTEGPRHILGWKSPNFMYVNAIRPRLKVLMRNFKLSDDIGFRFSNKSWSEYPLTAEKYNSWLNKLDPREEIINLFFNYEIFGKRHSKDSGIFDFIKYWTGMVISDKRLNFSNPSEIINNLQPMSIINVPHPISWADEERDLTAWLGNDMQKEAFNKLYEINRAIENCNDKKIINDWNYLQTSDHFNYMSTKYFTNGEIRGNPNPFDSPYEAFINYMNVLSDFKIRASSYCPQNKTTDDIIELQQILQEKNKQIEEINSELKRLKRKKRKN